MDQVEPPLDTPLRPHITINIQRIWEEIEYEEEILPFDTVWRPDDEVPIDQRLVKSTGREGVQRYRYRVRYEDGVEVSRTLEDDWVAVEPETKVIAYGQKITPQTLETPEGTITYWRKVRMYATSYSPARSGTPKTAPWYGRTRLGMELRRGVVAVDPAVVNMQQRLYVPGYGSAIAGDMGGGVTGKHIDLGYSDDDYRSWHWWTDVYLLWPPPAPLRHPLCPAQLAPISGPEQVDYVPSSHASSATKGVRAGSTQRIGTTLSYGSEYPGRDSDGGGVTA